MRRMEREDSAIATGLWVTGPNRLELRPSPLAELAPGMNRVRTLFSGVSRGTERLVQDGRVPASEYERMACPRQRGQFPFPVLYGYAAVGIVEAGPLSGQTVFCLHPHETAFIADNEALIPVPAGVPARRAVLAANMETALNALWDAGAGPGDRILIVGGGVVGGLTLHSSTLNRLAPLSPRPWSAHGRLTAQVSPILISSFTPARMKAASPSPSLRLGGRPASSNSHGMARRMWLRRSAAPSMRCA